MRSGSAVALAAVMLAVGLVLHACSGLAFKPGRQPAAARPEQVATTPGRVLIPLLGAITLVGGFVFLLVGNKND